MISKSTAITNRTYRQLVLDGPIREAVDTIGSDLANLFRNVVSARDDYVCAQFLHQLLIRAGRVGDNTRTRQ